MSGGSFGYWRGLTAGSTEVGPATLLAAVEGTLSAGPWVLDERGRKLNTLLKYSAADWSLGLSGYFNRWTSTDQVPERAVRSGLTSPLGAIDPDLGGKAVRLALTFNGSLGAARLSAYAIGSRLRLTSNFTYFLDDPVNGDEFRQVDRRGVFGGSVAHEIKGETISLRFGADARWDHIGTVGLYRSIGGRIASTVREDRVDEYGGGAWGEAETVLAPGLRLIAGLRGDAIGYSVRSDLPVNSGSGSAAILAPKFALAWQVAPGIELYANYGHHLNLLKSALPHNFHPTQTQTIRLVQ